jgi:hypothetical protein
MITPYVRSDEPFDPTPEERILIGVLPMVPVNVFVGNGFKTGWLTRASAIDVVEFIRREGFKLVREDAPK